MNIDKESDNQNYDYAMEISSIILELVNQIDSKATIDMDFNSKGSQEDNDFVKEIIKEQKEELKLNRYVKSELKEKIRKLLREIERLNEITETLHSLHKGIVKEIRRQ